MTFLDGSERGKVIVGELINIVAMVSVVIRLRHEQDKQHRLKGGECDQDMKEISPSEVRSDGAHNDSGEVAGGTQYELDEGHEISALMHEEEITD